jgi:prepilin-type N-terminal cleavage/methylation domain-containing protein
MRRLQAMKNQERRGRGFTLVELLIVITIIGILMSLLLPAVTSAMQIVRINKTRMIIKDIGVAVEAFKQDFGVYPPSAPRNPTNPATVKNWTDPNQANSGEMRSSAANLVYYLRGPSAVGWGSSSGGLVPFPGLRTTQVYGPYYLADEENVRYETVNSNTVPYGFLDAFNPPNRIMYFRYDTNPATTNNNRYNYAEGYSNYDYKNDETKDSLGNPLTDPSGKFGYPSQNNLLACGSVILSGSGGSAIRKWANLKYLLVSPGLDGRYGFTKATKATGDVVPSINPETESDDATYTTPATPDDVTNWN